jgi:hypothetical protein
MPRRLGLVCAGSTRQRVVLASPGTAGNKLLLLLLLAASFQQVKGGSCGLSLWNLDLKAPQLVATFTGANALSPEESPTVPKYTHTGAARTNCGIKR